MGITTRALKVGEILFGETTLDEQQQVDRLAGAVQKTQETEEKSEEAVGTITRGLATILNRIDLIEEAFRDAQQRGAGLAGS